MLTLKGLRLSKKLIISLSVCLGVIAVILILFWTLFALSTVEVEYHTTTKNLSLSNEEIVEAGKFSYGACVFFDGKSKCVENINSKASEKENFAYLEVVNIETVFPNRYIIHVAEREEVFAVKANSVFYVCDEDLRVLRIVDEFVSEKDNPILLENLTINNEVVRVGDFLDVEQTGVLTIYDELLRNNRTLIEQQGFIESISLGTNYVEVTDKTYISVTIKTFQGRTYVINNIDFALANKFQLMFAVDSVLFSNINSDGYLVDENGEIVCDRVFDDDGNIMTDENGDYLKGEPWTYQRILNSYVLIDNFVLNDYQEVSETDIFYNLVEF